MNPRLLEQALPVLASSATLGGGIGTLIGGPRKGLEFALKGITIPGGALLGSALPSYLGEYNPWGNQLQILAAGGGALLGNYLVNQLLQKESAAKHIVPITLGSSLAGALIANALLEPGPMTTLYGLAQGAALPLTIQIGYNILKKDPVARTVLAGNVALAGKLALDVLFDKLLGYTPEEHSGFVGIMKRLKAQYPV